MVDTLFNCCDINNQTYINTSSNHFLGFSNAKFVPNIYMITTIDQKNYYQYD